MNKKAISSSESSERVTNAQNKIPLKIHHLFKNRRANLKTYTHTHTHTHTHIYIYI